MKSYLIVGAGVAGTTASAAIRKQDPKGQIVLVGAEDLPFYSRIRLPDYLAGRVGRDRLLVRDPSWYAEQRIELRTSTRAESVDLKESRLFFSNGTSLPYDALLLSTGATSVIPSLSGHQLPGVVTVRTVADADKLRALAQEAKNAVVIGGGLLGLEMASSLNHLGIEVTVVEVAPWLLPRQLDREGGELLRRILERSGLRFRVGAKAGYLLGKEQVHAVSLSSGEELPATVVLISAGTTPEVGLAKKAGITVRRGIVIDHSTATSQQGIYAAGDCAEHRGVVYGIWPAAEAQGKVAGKTMAGGQASYTGTLPIHTLKVSGINVFSAGEYAVTDKSRCRWVRNPDTYQKEVLDEEGKTVGAILIGDLSNLQKILAKISTPNKSVNGSRTS